MSEYKPLTPTRSQAQFILNCVDPGYKNNFYIGGIGCGKTQVECQVITDIATTIPGNHIAVVRKVRADLEGTIYTEFMNSVNQDLILEEKKSDLLVIVKTPLARFPSSIEFRGMDNRSRWGGTQFGQIVADEVSEFTHLEYWTLPGRLRYKYPKECIEYLVKTNSPYIVSYYDRFGKEQYDVHRFLAAVGNPTDELHWLYKDCVRQKSPTTSLVQGTTYENFDNLPEDYKEIIRKYPKSLQNTKVLGNWGLEVSGEPCTPSFNIEQNTFRGHIPLDPVKIIRGWDFGYTYPSVGFWEERDGKYFKWFELLGQRIYLSKFIQEVLKISAKFNHNSDFEDWVDHQAANQHSMSGEKTSMEQLQDIGIHGKSKFSKPRSRAEMLDTLFIENKIYIHADNCPLSIGCYSGGWHYPSTGDPDVPDKDPLDKNHNIADADGYALNGVLGPTRRDRTKFRVPRYNTTRQYDLDGYGRSLREGEKVARRQQYNL